LFEALEGLVYPDFARCQVEAVTPAGAVRRVGGIDFGWANPFAAVWGVHDSDDVLWIQDERYERHCPLHRHAQALPREVRWYADPAGRTEIEELRCAGFVVQKGNNTLQAGIAAVQARIQTGRLKVHATRCPNLLSEAGLYRYPRPDERARCGEDPVDEHNHALAALRYLISQLDHKFLVRFRRGSGGPDEARAEEMPRLDRPDLWTVL
jgi:hypothetical protein